MRPRVGLIVGSLVVGWTVAGHAPARAEPAVAPVPAAPVVPEAKKLRVARTKSTRHGAPPAPGARPRPLVNLYNLWTKEWLAVEAGAPPSHETIDGFLRDHFTNQRAAMQPRLVDVVVAAAARFHGDVVHIVSGFRHPKYNLILRKKGHQVARDSQHTHGNAIDFSVPGVPIAALHAWAKAQKLGGVGVYPDSGFVHMDIGPVRSWSGE